MEKLFLLRVLNWTKDLISPAHKHMVTRRRHLNLSFQWVLQTYNNTAMQLIDLFVKIMSHKVLRVQTTWEWDWFGGHENIRISYNIDYGIDWNYS